MKARAIRDNVEWMGAVDWDRRLFDSLIPLPDGTSYNAYLVRGSEKVALLDTVDPPKKELLLKQLEDVEHLDYVVAHHAEQDHAGAIPDVLARYPQAQVVATPKGKELLMAHLLIDEGRFITVDDGESLSLGDKTLTFMHMPWVHWPETMISYLPEERIAFTCDFFGSHVATSELYVREEWRVYEAAKRYYAEIMMPFRRLIQRHLRRMRDLDLDLIAPSHGPVYQDPDFILDAYEDWTDEEPKNIAVVPYVSMHGSTRRMVERLVGALASEGVTVYQFDLAVTDIGKWAIALVDAASLVIGSPTIHRGPHPMVHYAAYLANALRPKLCLASIIGSYGWATNTVDIIAGLIPDLKADVLDPVLCVGYPEDQDLQAVDALAAEIAARHREWGLM